MAALQVAAHQELFGGLALQLRSLVGIGIGVRQQVRLGRVRTAAGERQRFGARHAQALHLRAIEAAERQRALVETDGAIEREQLQARSAACSACRAASARSPANS